MITFLASPKPFKGIAKEQQYRAIRSWLASGVDVEVILYGNSVGINEAGVDLGVKVVRQIDAAPSGIPYFGAIASHAAEHGKHDLQVYLNCDILLSGIQTALERIDFDQFLLIGQCINLGEGVVVDTAHGDHLEYLNELARDGKVTLRPPCGIDYFGFRRGLWMKLQPIIIGRGAYDSALLAYCLRQEIPLVDATFAVTALHQYHNHNHVLGGQHTIRQGPDAKINLKYSGGHSLANIADSCYVLKGLDVCHLPCRGDWLRRLEMMIRYRLRFPTASLTIRLIWRIFQLIGLSRVVTPTLEEVIAAQKLVRTATTCRNVSPPYSNRSSQTKA